MFTAYELVKNLCKCLMDLSFLLRFVNIVQFHIMTCKCIWDSVYSSIDITVWIKASTIFRV